MVVYPYLLNNGFLLYKDIINPYPPLLTYLLAIFSDLFGYKPFAFQLLTWLVIITTDILIYKISLDLFKKRNVAILSVIFFIFFSIPFQVNGLWFDLVQTPLILLTVYYFYKFLEENTIKPSKNLLLASIAFWIAILVKQQIVHLGILILIISIIKFQRKILLLLRKNLLMLLLSVITITAIVMFFFAKGTIEDMIYWALYFPFIKASTQPGYLLLPTTKQLIILISLLSVFAPLIVKSEFKNKFLTLSAFTMVVFTYPRFDYFHLIPAVATFSLLVPKLLDHIKFHKQYIPIISVPIFFLLIFSMKYYSNNINRQIRFFEPSIYQAAQKINENLDKENKIFLLNAPDQLLVISKRLPIKPWADDFPWYFEGTGLDAKVIKGLETDKPKNVLFQEFVKAGPYDLGSYRSERIFEYVKKNYKNKIRVSNDFWLMEQI